MSAQGPGGPLLPLIGGPLPATDEIVASAARLQATLDDLVGGAHRAGVLRADFTPADIPLLLEHLSARIPVTGERAAEFHLRPLDLVLAGLRISAGQFPAVTFPQPRRGEPLTWRTVGRGNFLPPHRALFRCKARSRTQQIHSRSPITMSHSGRPTIAVAFHSGIRATATLPSSPKPWRVAQREPAPRWS
ncbi:hypothetical protein ACFWWT_30440 [Streptomyces sp. NPDC058676]|uniref:hypothetical protein n=1 Tax=unclassified Streptomyces TaxID=2593676 RepID=UPI00364B5BD8